jgi:hypothetical protein
VLDHADAHRAAANAGQRVVAPKVTGNAHEEQEDRGNLR